jgi:hypothetical protein
MAYPADEAGNDAILTALFLHGDRLHKVCLWKANIWRKSSGNLRLASCVSPSWR